MRRHDADPAADLHERAGLDLNGRADQGQTRLVEGRGGHVLGLGLDPQHGTLTALMGRLDGVPAGALLNVADAGGVKVEVAGVPLFGLPRLLTRCGMISKSPPGKTLAVGIIPAR